MNKKQFLKTMALAMGLMASCQLFSQVSWLGNNGGPTDYVGWDSNTGLTLRVMNNGNQPIQWFTDSIQRMLMMETASYTINTQTAVGDGSLLICPDVTTFGAPGPFTRLHLADGIAGSNDHESIYRDWMKNGITMTGNGDGMYVGQRYNQGEDRTDATITWSDNPGEWRRDRLTFNFVSGTGQDEGGCDSPYGIQTMLVQPDEDCAQAYVGIGDFDAVSETPDERLDVLDRTVRIRHLVPGYYTDTLDRYVVTDHTGRLHWRYIPPPTGGADCDWTVQNATTSGATVPHNVYTAVGTSANCPDASDKVGIGTSAPNHKLSVVANEAACVGCGVAGGIAVDVQSDNSGNGVGVNILTRPATNQTTADIFGLHAESRNGTAANTAIWADARCTTGNTVNSRGIWARSTAEGGGTVSNSHGVRGLSTASNFGGITTGYGVWGIKKMPRLLSVYTEALPQMLLKTTRPKEFGVRHTAQKPIMGSMDKLRVERRTMAYGQLPREPIPLQHGQAIFKGGLKSLGICGTMHHSSFQMKV